MTQLVRRSQQRLAVIRSLSPELVEIAHGKCFAKGMRSKARDIQCGAGLAHSLAG
jgi:hypothetical protein